MRALACATPEGAQTPHDTRDVSGGATQIAYKKRCRELGQKPHGATMPLRLARFLIEYGSEPGHTVADPFGGSQTTAHATEQLGRRWISTEVCLD